MQDDLLRIEVEVSGIDGSNLRAAFAADPRARFVERRNLSGADASWVVIATLAVNHIAQALPHLVQMSMRNRVKRIRVGDVEIENPTPEDLELLLLRKRLAEPRL
jgi:hypothetical protein